MGKGGALLVDLTGYARVGALPPGLCPSVSVSIGHLLEAPALSIGRSMLAARPSPPLSAPCRHKLVVAPPAQSAHTHTNIVNIVDTVTLVTLLTLVTLVTL